MSTIERVGVVGAGLMGSGIAEVSARAGLDVTVVEVDAGALEAGQRRIGHSFDRGVKAGKISAADRDAAVGRIRFTTTLDDLADRDLVVEAVAEVEALKLDVFAQLDKIVTRPDAIFASNTSSIPIMKLAMATARPTQVIGVHFFNPAPVLNWSRSSRRCCRRTRRGSGWRSWPPTGSARPSSGPRTEPGSW